MANSGIVIMPCTVNSWLYRSGETIHMPGRAGPARITLAGRPADRRNPDAVTRCVLPITV
ncbi:hypothetical protein CP967_01580 [Streptomyces nitrosporeus]|uniref:Uncharacterized protein n=1 Tax=Streptomyces nitrosporeus TaxID=28894 RepID=A0A5J6F492_9ACTN|nr:hypothetical protein CP967_01580 [Streptomyces nitrosporeus]GGZ24771.1 hypothetical protein GCM10010327_64510 [Streptomyces nitrosporeus]